MAGTPVEKAEELTERLQAVKELLARKTELESQLRGVDTELRETLRGTGLEDHLLGPAPRIRTTPRGRPPMGSGRLTQIRAVEEAFTAAPGMALTPAELEQALKANPRFHTDTVDFRVLVHSILGKMKAKRLVLKKGEKYVYQPKKLRTE